MIEEKLTKEQEVIEAFWQLLTFCPRWKMKIIKWLLPEIKKASEILMNYYWNHTHCCDAPSKEKCEQCQEIGLANPLNH